MKFLITGATGLVGRQLSAALLANGHGVHFLTMHPHKRTAISGASGFYWHPAQGIIDEGALLGVDVIIHLAGESIASRWTPARKQAIVESRVLTSNLLYKVLKNNPHQVKQIISASGIGIYPQKKSHTYTEESVLQDPGFVGQVVVKWEEAVMRFLQLGIIPTVVRTGLVLSREGGALVELEKPVKLGLGAPLGSGGQIYSWIHINDLVAIYIFLAERRLSGIFNAVAPNPVTNKIFTQSLAKVLQKPLLLPPVPAFVLRIILGEMHQILVSGQHVSASKIVENGFNFQFPELLLALRDLYSR